MTRTDWATAAIQCVFYTSLAFVVLISLFWSWWKTQLGWTIALKSLAIAAAVFLEMLEVWFGPGFVRDHPGLETVSIVSLFCVPLILIWRLVVLYRIQRAGAMGEAEQAAGGHGKRDRNGHNGLR